MIHPVSIQHEGAVPGSSGLQRLATAGAKGQAPALRFKQHNWLSSGLWFLTCRQSTCVYVPDLQLTDYEGMQTLLIPLWCKRVANDALIEPLKDAAPLPPRLPGEQLEARTRGCARGRQSRWGVSFPLPKPALAAATATRLLSGSRSLSEARYLWFQKRIRWGG